MLRPDPVPAGAAAIPAAPPQRGQIVIAVVMFAIAAAAILGALGFQYIGGYQPCALCLMQRTPYYIGVPVAALAIVAVWLNASRWLLAALFAAFGLLMLYNAGLGAYHAGVEWKFWEGPAACAPSVGVASAADLLNQLENTVAPSCIDAVWRFLGLSFAGWNVLIAGFLAALGLYAAANALRLRRA